MTTDYLQQCPKFYVKPKADHPWLTRRTQSNQQVKPPKLPRKKADPDKMD
ncbi:hypothetical protein [Klebsiella pneumoniae]|nr:hypothetical protein [Klebsiella pneumoniae]